jgi:hypothetical protein
LEEVGALLGRKKKGRGIKKQAEFVIYERRRQVYSESGGTF